MERQNIIKEKSFLFAIEIVGLYKILAEKKSSFYQNNYFVPEHQLEQMLENLNMRKAKLIYS